jgi:hypothetical protein
MNWQCTLVACLITAACFAQQEKEPPRSSEPAIAARPSEQDKARAAVKAPALNVSEQEAAKAAVAFLDWAGASTAGQREEIRRMLEQASQYKAVAAAFCDEANRTAESDFTRSLLALSVLGEMRSPVGTNCFQKFLHRPLPEKGIVANGENVEQTKLAMLQAKAVDGLAYLRTAATDREVLWAVGKHPSRIVRAEAIEAYLWNHKDSKEARTTLLKYVQPKERVFVDRVRRDPAEEATGFNRKLTAFLKAHPEAVAPAPKRIEQKGEAAKPPKEDEPPVR